MYCFGSFSFLDHGCHSHSHQTTPFLPLSLPPPPPPHPHTHTHLRLLHHHSPCPRASAASLRLLPRAAVEQKAPALRLLRTPSSARRCSRDRQHSSRARARARAGTSRRRGWRSSDGCPDRAMRQRCVVLLSHMLCHWLYFEALFSFHKRICFCPPLCMCVLMCLSPGCACGSRVW